MTTRSADGRRRPIRALAGIGLVAGGALAGRPRAVVAALSPGFPESRIWVVRVLGARLLTQHAALLAAPRRPAARAAVAVDVLHAASMLPLLASPRYRRAALVSGGFAAAWAAAAAVAGGSEGG